MTAKKFFWAIFSKAFVAPKFSPDSDIALKELSQSTKVLGISSQNILFYKCPIRNFPEFRQDILEIAPIGY